MSAREPEHELERWLGATVAGKYRIERLLGRGGMGAVFAAQNIAIHRRVAIKFLSREAARDREATRRFQREAQAAGSVSSEHVVQVLDAGTSDDGVPFIVMEELSGEDLRTRLAREPRLAVPDAVAIGVQMLRALARTHLARIVHRDMKPDNVFLCHRDDGSLLVKVLDFGISKLERGTASERLTRRGTVLGSAYYMAPEQAQASDSVDQRADIYGVGAILFEMLAGRPPHLGPTLESVLVAICTQTAPNITNFRPDVAPALARLIARALERNPNARFANASAMLAELSGTPVESASPAEVHAGTHAARPERASTSRGALRARSRSVAFGALAALGGFALTALVVASRSRSDEHTATESLTAAPSATTHVVATESSAALAVPVVTPVSAASVVSAPSSDAPGGAAAVALASGPSASAKPPRKTVPERQRHAVANARGDSSVASSLHLSTRGP